MKQNREKGDALARVDFDAIHPDTPEVFRDAVRLAGEDVRRYELRRRARRRALTMAAAALMLLAGVSAAMLSLAGARRDSVTAPPVRVEIVDGVPVEVYASKRDPYYHRAKNCPRADAGAVALPLITAREFEKTPCPECWD